MTGKEQLEAWRIPRMPCRAAYPRAYGWSWLAPLGVLIVVSGAAGLILEGTQRFWPWLVFGGFAATFTGAVLAGFSERQRMLQIEAQCLDIQVKRIGASLSRSAGWDVRALVRYRIGEREYEATPEPLGYFYFFHRDSAEDFARQLRESSTVTIYVDSKRPQRTLFLSPKPGGRSRNTAP